MKKIIILLFLAVSLFTAPHIAFSAVVGANFNQHFTSGIGNAENAIAKAGPALANRLVGVSGEIFNYLAIIAVVLFAVKEILFGDKGIKEFMIFFLFLAFAKGLLMAYNLFFYDGVYIFFYGIGQKVSGLNSPMQGLGQLFQNFYSAIGVMDKTATSKLSWTDVAGAVALAITVAIDQIILIIEALVIIGTIVLVQVYVAIALLTGYIFVPFMIIKPLEFLWNGWLKFIITACLSYFLLFLVMALLNKTIINLTGEISNHSQGLSAGAVLSLLLIMGIFAYIFLKIPSVAGEIVSGMPNMSFSGVVSVAIGAAAVMMGGARIAGGGAKGVARVAKGLASRDGGGKQ